MPIATNNVRYDESPVGRQGSAYPVEKMFERRNMMQGLVGDHRIVAMLRPPPIQVDLLGITSIDAGPICVRCTPREHRCVDIEAVDREIAAPIGQQSGRQPDLGVAIAAPTLNESSPASTYPLVAGLRVDVEEHVRMSETERRELGNEVAVRPVVEDRRQLMDVFEFGERGGLGRDSLIVGGRPQPLPCGTGERAQRRRQIATEERAHGSLC